MVCISSLQLNVAIRNERDAGENETSERLTPFMIKVIR